jgi:hypothetical protein
MLIWSEKVRKHNRQAAASRLFIRRRLMTLGLGKNLSRFAYGNKSRVLVSEEEALASLS